MHYTKLISEENFSAGRPLLIFLPQAEDGTTNEEVGYLIEELHISGRWPILVYNVDYKMKGNVYREINQCGTYIILTPGPCMEWELYIRKFWQQLQELIFGNSRDKSWNPRAKFLVPLMLNCTQFDNRNISRAILELLWIYRVMNVAVFFLNSNKHAGNDLQQNSTDSTQGTYLELHTWYPYENSERCSPTEGTVPVKVFTVRNLSEIRRSDVFRGYIDKNLKGCPITIVVKENPLFWYSTDQIRLLTFKNGELNC
jgi:hypothetical protein